MDVVAKFEDISQGIFEIIMFKKMRRTQGISDLNL